MGAVRPSVHYEATVGSYCVCLLMPKLAGEALSMDLFCNTLLEEREAVREAFEEAWLQVLLFSIQVTFADFLIQRRSQKWYCANGSCLAQRHVA